MCQTPWDLPNHQTPGLSDTQTAQAEQNRKNARQNSKPETTRLDKKLPETKAQTNHQRNPAI